MVRRAVKDITDRDGAGAGVRIVDTPAGAAPDGRMRPGTGTAQQRALQSPRGEPTSEAILETTAFPVPAPALQGSGVARPGLRTTSATPAMPITMPASARAVRVSSNIAYAIAAVVSGVR